MVINAYSISNLSNEIDVKKILKVTVFTFFKTIQSMSNVFKYLVVY